MQEHHLKTHPQEFQSAIDGVKTFELRQNDRDFQVGDLLVLEEWEPPEEGETHFDDDFHYTGRKAAFYVTYILRGGKWGLAPDYVIMATQPRDMVQK